MTSIVWHQGKLMADSLAQNGREWIHVSDKAASVRRRVFWTQDGDPEPDPILLATYSGAKEPSYKIILDMEEMCSLIVEHASKGKFDFNIKDLLETRLKPIVDLGMMNDDNIFNLFMVGVRYNYHLSMVPNTLTLERLEKDTFACFGTGGIHMRDLYNRYEGEVSAEALMAHGLHMDSFSGGRVYQYAIEPSKRSYCGYEGMLTGVYEEFGEMFRASIIVNPKIKAPPDLVPNLNGPEWIDRDRESKRDLTSTFEWCEFNKAVWKQHPDMVPSWQLAEQLLEHEKFLVELKRKDDEKKAAEKKAAKAAAKKAAKTPSPSRVLADTVVKSPARKRSSKQ